MDSAAGTSKEADVKFDEDFIRRARHMPISQLMEELKKLQNDDHPLLRTVRRNILEEHETQKDRIECHRSRAEAKAETDYKSKAAEIEQDYEKRINELAIEAERRCEEFEKTVYNDFLCIDINKQIPLQPTYETNKKTLRGRGQPMEIQTYLNANQSVKLPDTSYSCAFDDHRIRKDIEKISNVGSAKRNIQHVVLIQKPKITIGKATYKQGEDVYASNDHFKRFHARIEVIGDRNVLLKGAQAWDTRQIDASIEDLEDARVELFKKKDNSSRELRP